MGEARIGVFKKRGKKLAYSSRVIDVYTERILTPGGREVDWVLAEHGGAAAVVAVTENDEIVLVKQYRNTADEYVWEIPAGGLSEGEEPIHCAARELEEETGFKAGHLTYMFAPYSSIGFCTERIHYYLATDLQKGALNLDPDEYLIADTFPLETVLQMINSGEIVDGKTISGVFGYLIMHERGLI
ncbi:MAG: NUDIX hydrolase [Eubacteriales bacterium]|nr:NUDIX hydrolase [Eubacteriales bacterium]